MELTQEQINQGNIRIIKYLGYELIFDDLETYPNGYWHNEKEQHSITDVYDLSFHDNFIKIMSVLEEIEKNIHLEQ